MFFTFQTADPEKKKRFASPRSASKLVKLKLDDIINKLINY